MLPETLLFAAPGSLGLALIAGLFGLLIGSFLNVVIHRLPIMMDRAEDSYIADKQGKPEPYPERYNLTVPRSACPHCGHKITALENIPVISWLALRGKCSSCKAKISARYPLVELLTGVLAGVMVWNFGSGWAGLGAMVFVFLVVAMTFIDFDTKLLPDDLTLPLMWLGLLLNLGAVFTPLQNAVIGAMVGYMTLWSVNALYKLVRGHDGMGYGDFKLLAALGAWMGWQALPAIILLSSVVGAVVGISLMVFGKNNSKTQIPFGPYLAGAGLLALWFGPGLLAFTDLFTGALLKMGT